MSHVIPDALQDHPASAITLMRLRDKIDKLDAIQDPDKETLEERGLLINTHNCIVEMKREILHQAKLIRFMNQNT